MSEHGDAMAGMLAAEPAAEPPEWLFDSHGEAVAFRVGDDVFTSDGDFVGRLDGDVLWHGTYRGELLRGNRLLRNLAGSMEEREPPTPPRWSPEPPTRPAGCRGAIGLPVGYRDVRL